MCYVGCVDVDIITISTEMDDESDNEDTHKSMNTSRSSSVKYDWMEGVDINDGDKSDSSSDDALLNFNIKNIDHANVEALLSDNKSTDNKSSRKHKKKKKKKKKKKDKDRKSKKSKRKKKKKGILCIFYQICTFN